MSAAEQFVEAFITNNKVVVFSKSWCHYSQNVKNLLTSNFPVEKIGVIELDERDDGAAIQDYLFTKTNQRTVPNVFVKQKHIGGCDDTTKLFDSGELAKLIAA